MDNFYLLVIAVLFILLVGFLIFYFQTQQSFQEITAKLEEIQHPPNTMVSSETFKRELALHHDKLVLLEADISKNNRESLIEEELKMFDVARHQIKASIAGLKASGEWVGRPFEYEWAEILDRLPNVLGLYRKSEADKRAKEIEQDQGAKPAN
jgi:hypothetical protein